MELPENRRLYPYESMVINERPGRMLPVEHPCRHCPYANLVCGVCYRKIENEVMKREAGLYRVAAQG